MRIYDHEVDKLERDDCFPGMFWITVGHRTYTINPGQLRDLVLRAYVEIEGEFS